MKRLALLSAALLLLAFASPARAFSPLVPGASPDKEKDKNKKKKFEPPKLKTDSGMATPALLTESSKGGGLVLPKGAEGETSAPTSLGGSGSGKPAAAKSASLSTSENARKGTEAPTKKEKPRLRGR